MDAKTIKNLQYLLDNSRNSQVVPLQMNRNGTITQAGATVTFVASNAVNAVGLYSTDNTKIDKVFLIIMGRVENTFDGVNELDCATATDNQWQANLNGGAWADLVNDQADGQMADGDWHCGSLHDKVYFQFEFDVTALVTDIDGHIGVRLENADADQDNLEVYIDVFLRIDWKL